MNINAQEKLFDIPDDVSYFNIAGISPLLQTVVAAGQKGLQIKSHPWKIGGDQFFYDLEKVRSLFARLINAQGDDVAVIPSATYGVEAALKNIQIRSGDEILVQDEEFPALILPIKRFCLQTQAVLKVVPRPKDSNWTSVFTKSITQKTKLVAFGISHWTDGTYLDPIAVSKKAHEVGAYTLLDACQSLGALPLNVQEVKLDFLVAPTYKWLLGPYTYGFMYVHPKHHQGQPLEEYWANRLGSDNFSTLTQYEPRYQPGARRYDMSERSQFINTPMAISALEQILDWGIDKILNHNKEITDYIADEVQKHSYLVAPKQMRSPHFIGIRSEKGFSDTFKARLESEKIYVGYRGDCMRISPYVYTKEENVMSLLGVLST